MFTLLADKLVYELMGFSANNQFGAALHFFVEDTTKIFALMAVLIFAVGFLRTWVSESVIRRFLGKKAGWLAYVAAAGLGALTPFCSCSSLPLFMAFCRAGVPLGVGMAFLITSPMVNEVAAVLYADALGWHFTLAYIGIGIALGLLGGVLVDRAGLERWLKTLDVAPAHLAADGLPLKNRAHIAWAEAKGVIARVWEYILLGVALGALIHGYVPRAWILSHLGVDNLWAVPAGVLAGIPLYANATGVVPIAQTLIDKGLPVGTTLAFIMSTVAISLPELAILSRLMRPRLMVAFVAYLALAFMVVGYGFNALF